MKNIFTILLAFTFITTVSSCKKEEIKDPNNPNNPNAPACVRNNTGIFTVDSYMEDPYYVYVDGGYRGTVSAYGLSSYTLTAGTYSIKFEQKSGYILYPTVKNRSITISKCYELTVKLQ